MHEFLKSLLGLLGKKIVQTPLKSRKIFDIFFSSNQNGILIDEFFHWLCKIVEKVLFRFFSRQIKTWNFGHLTRFSQFLKKIEKKYFRFFFVKLKRYGISDK